MDPSSSTLPPLNVNLDTTLSLDPTLGVPTDIPHLGPTGEAESHPALDSLLQSIQDSTQDHIISSTLLDSSLSADPSALHQHHDSSAFDYTQHVHDPNDPNAHLMSTTSAPVNAVSVPMSEFTRAREAVLEEHVPRVQRLAKNVLVGITHAYEPGMDASRTASDLNELREAFATLQRILNESGLGALPIDPSSLLSAPSSTPGSTSTPLSTLKNSSLSPSQQEDPPESPSKMAIDGQDVGGGVLDDKVATRRVEEMFGEVKRRKDAADVALNILGWAS